MKKKIILMFIMLLPIYVLADCSVITDNQTTETRKLTCDKSLRTQTTYKMSDAKEVLKNDVCTIKCTEELTLMIDPVKKVLSGMSFKYPLYVSGIRKCTATYNYVNYEATIKRLVEEYSSITDSTLKATKKNEITNYYEKRKQCDNFTLEDSDYQNKYEVKGDVKLKLSTSTTEENIQYVYEDISEYSSVVTKNEKIYNSCKFNEITTECIDSTKTIENWTETARVFGKYTMPDAYIEKYTGEVKKVSSSSNTCNAKDRYFVSFKELTTPTTDPTNNGYSLVLEATNIGKNIVSDGVKWNLTAQCYYKVKNLSFPQGSNSSIDKDENNDKYGNVLFMYRQIDLNNPFPDRQAGSNWIGKESRITSTANNIKTYTRFTIALDSSSIQRIREYNDVYPYDTFNLNEMEKSNFIIQNTTIFNRK